MNEKTILLGLHERKFKDHFSKSYCSLCKSRGYTVDLVRTPDEMLEKAGANDYQRYLMDANLGNPNSANVEPAAQVYELIKPKVEEGLAKFMAISPDERVVFVARKRGIPAENSLDFNLEKFLE